MASFVSVSITFESNVEISKEIYLISLSLKAFFLLKKCLCKKNILNISHFLSTSIFASKRKKFFQQNKIYLFTLTIHKKRRNLKNKLEKLKLENLMHVRNGNYRNVRRTLFQRNERTKFLIIAGTNPLTTKLL